MPRVADPAVRAALVETAAQILATEGPSRLTLRHLATRVGTSTMAIYTHFGGMDQLRLEVCTEGFRRLAAHLAAVARTDDPVADLNALGAAYTTNARQNPHLYRAMFLDRLPVTTPVDVGFGLPGEGAVAGGVIDDEAMAGVTSELMAESMATFEVLVEVTMRCVDAGRFSDPRDPRTLAAELWGATHGIVALELAGLIDTEHASVLLASTGRHLALAFGDEPAAHAVSTAAAVAARTS
ncbi:MAG TPA: TetR/AcrR family transcriptional regulator [Acidimicrobiales bacterium]|nr:TetR/AcrR family transcriptional regulator [Acidimicrobiales bacterium]